MKDLIETTPECYPYGHERIEEMKLHSERERSSLTMKLYSMIQDYGIALSPDVLLVAVKEMIEHLEEEEYRYILDLFEFFELPPPPARKELTPEQLKKEYERMKKDMPVIATRLSLDVLKAVAKKGNKNGASKKSTRR